ncbi:MAG: rod shape-determining protein MreD [Deltaproteobacteria bacterium]|nr:rod shape-determining protein MreD [Deltaproteobacteria bacterium]MBI2363725.1 rod shape-determining protein MreD [Deltaproteobacteria bacterium]MBI2534141.1 rod shape-determining protein MreD [Deltaproteobacteria bacterium]
MKLSLLFFAVGLILVLLQTTLLHLLPLGPIVPDFVLVLLVYWGLYHPTVGAVVASFLLGYSVDVVSSPILGLNAFAMSMVFLAVHLSSRSIWLHDPMASAIVVLLASLVKGAALALLSAVFLTVESFWISASLYIIIEALIAAALAPFVFPLLRRGQSYVERFRVTA